MFNRLLAVTAVCLLMMSPRTPCSVVASELSRLQNLIHSTVRIQSGGDTCSGIVISPQGHVLTVAHGLGSGSTHIRVTGWDGRTCTAETIVVDQKKDLAVLQCAEWGGASAGTSAPSVCVTARRIATSPEMPVIGCGWPAFGGPQNHGQLRLGKIQSQSENDLRTDCLLSTGDSGGPLLNLQGHLIGLHRRIGLAADANYHIPLPVLQEFLSGHSALKSLLQSCSGRLELLRPEDLRPPDTASLAGIRKQLLRLVDHESGFAGHGILVGPGRGVVVANSIAGSDSPAILGDGTELLLKLAGPADLKRNFCSVITESETAGGRKLRGATATIGMIVFSVWLSPEEGTLQIRGPGIISQDNHSEPRAGVILGMKLQAKTSGIRVIDVLPAGPAQEAGLQAGDTLLTVNSAAVANTDLLRQVLEPFQPGDRIAIRYQREDVQRQTQIVAQHDPAELFDRRIYLDGRAGPLSLRRTGLQQMISHDLAILPSECGSVLITAKGEVIGLNISRIARQCVLTAPLPAEALAD